MKEPVPLTDSIYHEGYINKDGFGEYWVTASTVIDRQEEVFYQRRDQVEWDADRGNLRVLTSQHFYDGVENPPGPRDPDRWEREVPPTVAPGMNQAWQGLEQYKVDPTFLQEVPVWTETRSDHTRIYPTWEALEEDRPAQERSQHQAVYYLYHENQAIKLGEVVSYLDPEQGGEYRVHTVHNPLLSDMLVLRSTEEVRALLAESPGIYQPEDPCKSYELFVNGPVVLLRQSETLDSEATLRRETDRLLLSSEKGLELAWVRERMLENNQVIQEHSMAADLDKTQKIQKNGDLSL